MHPADAFSIALSSSPATVHDLIALLPPQAGLTPELTRDNPAAEKIVLNVEREIIHRRRAAARRLDSATPTWEISWSSGWWMLYGHLYLTPGNKPDETSPLLLVDRSTLQCIYGPELVDLATRVVADTLLYDAFHERAESQNFS